MVGPELGCDVTTLLQTAEHEGRDRALEEDSEFVAVDHITITVQDVEAARHFYADLMGLRVLTDVTVDGPTAFGGFAVQDGQVVELSNSSDGTVYDHEHATRRHIIFERVGGVSLSLNSHPGDVLAGDAARKLDRVGYTHLAFNVRDLEAFVARMRSLGVEPVAPGFFRDPEGNLVQIQEADDADRIHQMYRDRYATPS
jgi:catechol 2,3-dioxygenase-like lactoylglutathione lyase family enzyme